MTTPISNFGPPTAQIAYTKGQFNHDTTRGFGETFGSFAAYGGVFVGGLGSMIGYATGGSAQALALGILAGGSTAFLITAAGKAAQYVLDKGQDALGYACSGAVYVISLPFKGAAAAFHAMASSQHTPAVEVSN